MSQRAIIKELFMRKPDTWIPLYEILPLAAQYNTRIKELREDGMDIENQIIIVDGVRHSAFRWNKPISYPYQPKFGFMR